MPWKRNIYREFRKVGKNPSLVDLFRPYMPLMSSLFPGPDFTVCPRSRSQSGRLLNYAQLDVYFENKPVLMLDINAPGDLRNMTMRQEAIQKIQERSKVLRPASEGPLPELHAVSAFGTKLCFFKVDHNQSIRPTFIATHPKVTPDLLLTPNLKKYWGCDIRKEEGEKKFKAIAKEIKRAYEALRDVHGK